MNETIKQNSLAELLDFIVTNEPPLSRDDLYRFNELWGIDLNFYNDYANAVLFYDNEEYHFDLNQKTKLYDYNKERK